jgi:hypothetical protein
VRTKELEPGKSGNKAYLYKSLEKPRGCSANQMKETIIINNQKDLLCAIEAFKIFVVLLKVVSIKQV